MDTILNTNGNSIQKGANIIATNPNWWTIQGYIDINLVEYPENINKIDQMLEFCLDKIKSESVSSDCEYTITVKSDEENPSWVVDYWDIDDEINKQIVIS